MKLKNKQLYLATTSRNSMETWFQNFYQVHNNGFANILMFIWAKFKHSSPLSPSKQTRFK